jgi:kynurenine formamidase
VERLIAARVRLVGVDFGNVDDTGDLSRPAHTGLLGAGIPIVENLRGLGRLPREGFVFSAPPLGIVHGAAFPVRAFAEVS